MPMFKQLLSHLLQQFPADSVTLEVGQNHQDSYLPGFEHAEAITNDFALAGADLPRKHARADILRPRRRSDAQGT